ncbi:MAG: hypothetical protein H0W74_07545 [Sphingosinicella sp.]|nr:hypothetical protein [Sphingosinicella sp.]
MNVPFQPDSAGHANDGEAGRSGPSTIERAFELARSGSCHNVQEIALKLKRERHDSVEAHLAGQSIRRELRLLCQEARAGTSSSE